MLKEPFLYMRSFPTATTSMPFSIRCRYFLNSQPNIEHFTTKSLPFESLRSKKAIWPRTVLTSFISPRTFTLPKRSSVSCTKKWHSSTEYIMPPSLSISGCKNDSCIAHLIVLVFTWFYTCGSGFFCQPHHLCFLERVEFQIHYPAGDNMLFCLA